MEKLKHLLICQILVVQTVKQHCLRVNFQLLRFFLLLIRRLSSLPHLVLSDPPGRTKRPRLHKLLLFIFVICKSLLFLENSNNLRSFSLILLLNMGSLGVFGSIGYIILHESTTRVDFIRILLAFLSVLLLFP